MAFDILGYRDKYKTHFKDAPLEDVAKYVYEQGGFSKDGDYDTWKKASGVDSVIQEETKKKKPVGDNTRGVTGFVKDSAIDLAKGAVGLGESAVGLANIPTFNLAGKALEKVGYDPKVTKEILSSGYSDERVAANKAVEEAKGFIETAKEYVENPSALVGSILESAPGTLGIAGAARGAAMKMLASAGIKDLTTAAGKKAASEFLKKPSTILKLQTISSIAEGVQSTGSIQESARQEEKDWSESVLPAVAAGIGTGGIAFLTSRIPGFQDAEARAAVIGLIQREKGAALRETGKTIAKSFFKEGVLEEMPQSAQEQVFTNLALDLPWDQGVKEAAAAGMMVGAVQGGAMTTGSEVMDRYTGNKAFDLQKLKEGAKVADVIHTGLTTGSVEDKPFAVPDAVSLIQQNLDKGIYASDDLDIFKTQYPQLRDDLNNIIASDITDKVDQKVSEFLGITPISFNGPEAEAQINQVQAKKQEKLRSEQEQLGGMGVPPDIGATFEPNQEALDLEAKVSQNKYQSSIASATEPKAIADYTKETDNHIKFLAQGDDSQARKEAERRGFEVTPKGEGFAEVKIPSEAGETEVKPGIHPNLQKALQKPMKISEDSATQIKIATKDTLTEKYKTGEIEEGAPIRFTSVDELRNIIKNDKLIVGSDFEGRPGISAQTMNKDTILVAYGPNNKISAAIVFPKTSVEGKGEQVNEVLMKAETPIDQLRFIIDGHKELLTFDQLKEVYKGDTIAQAIKEKPAEAVAPVLADKTAVPTPDVVVPKTTTHKTFKDYAVAMGYEYPETVAKAKAPMTAFNQVNAEKLKANGTNARQLAQQFRKDQGTIKVEGPKKTVKVKLVPKVVAKPKTVKVVAKKAEPKSNVTTLITKPMKEFHKTLQSEISEGVKNTQAKVTEYKGWKWEVGDRVKSHKTGKMWEVIGKTWNNQKNIPMYIMKNEADEEKSHFYAEPTKIRDMDIPSVYDGFTKLGTKPEVLKGGKTEVKPTEVKAAEKAVLPANLAKARPRYSYGEKKFTLKFDNDLDKAAYISAQRTKSKFDQDYVNHVMEKAKLTEADVRQHGKDIKESIKALAKDAADGTEIKVPKSKIPQFKASLQTQTNRPPITLKEVKTLFKGQEVIQPGGPNAPIYVKTRGGQYLSIESVSEINPNRLAFKISYGRDYDPKIDHLAGAYESGHIELAKGSTGKFELTHESVHFMEDVGIIDGHEVQLLTRHIKDLAKTGQYVTVNVEDVGGPEDRANFIAQELGKGKSEGLLNRIMDRIRDFVDGLVNAFGMRTVPGVIRDIQTGKIYEREGDLQKNNPALYALQQKLKPFFSQFTNVVTKKMGGKMPVDQLIKMLKSNGVTDAEIDQIIISDLSDDKKIFTRQEVMDAITANTTEFKDDVFGNPNLNMDYNALLADERIAAKEYLNSSDVDEIIAEANRLWTMAPTDVISLAQSYGYEPSSEFMNTDEPGKYAQYEQFSEPGYVPGSYRELFVTAPKSASNEKLFEFKGVKTLRYDHWSDGHPRYSSVENPIVRIRYNDRMIDGKKILFVEEMQGPSDRNQDKMPEFLRKRIYDIGVKRILALAKEGQYDGIAWTTGQMQADRYDLSKHLDTITVQKNAKGGFDIFGGQNGLDVIRENNIPEEKIADYIGKELATKAHNEIQMTTEETLERNIALERKSAIEKVIHNIEMEPISDSSELDRHKFNLNQVNLRLERLMPRVTYSGLDLKVGGEGLKSLYDKILPSMFKKYGKESISTTELKPGIKWTEDNELWFTKVGPVTYHIYRESNSEFVLAEGEYGSEEYKEYGTFDTLTEAKTEAEKIIKPSTQILLVTNSDMGYDILKDIRREEDLIGGEDSLLEDLQDSYNVDTVHSITDLDPAVIPILEKYAPGVFIRNNEISGQVKIDYQNLGDDGYDQVVNELEMITEKVDQDLDYQPLLDILYDFQHGVQVFSGRDAELLTKYMPDMITPVTVENQKVSMIPITDKTPASYPQYAVRTPRPPVIPTWDVDPPSKIDTFLRTFTDRFVDLRKVVKAIDTVHGQLEDAHDPSLQQILYSAKIRDGLDVFLRDELRPLLHDLSIDGGTLEGLHEYVHNRHAPEANAYIATINPELPDGGSGITNQAAQDYMRNLDPRTRALYSSAAQKYDAIARKNLQLLVDNGLESQKTIDTWLAKYEYYAPLYRADMEKNGGFGTGRGFTVVGGASKARHGSTRDVSNIIASIAEQRERYLTRIHKNNIDKALVTLAETYPNPDFWKLARPSVTERIGAEPATRGKVVKVVDMDYMYKDNVVMARTIDPKTGDVVQRGVEFNIENDRARETVKGLKNLDMDKLGSVLSLSAKVTRFISSMNTQYNVVFGIVNFVRDFQAAMLNLSSTELSGKQLDIAKGVLPALRVIYRDLRSEHMGHATHMTSALDPDWKDYRAHGGMVGYMDMYKTRADRLEAIQKEMDRSTKGMTQQLFHQVASWLSDYNTTIESGIRFSAYRVAIQNGFTKDRAAALAKNLTLDFNRKGTISMQAGALFAFFNATAQGSVRLYETLSSPLGQKIMAGGIMVGVLQALVLAAFDFDPDEPPEFIKERGFVIPTGGGKYISIPMPLGFHILPNIGRLTTEWAMSGFEKPIPKITNLLGMMVEATNPMGSSGWSLQTLSPTPFDPIVALAENKDWTGRKIFKEDMNPMVPTPGFSRARDAATGVSYGISWALNRLSGGSQYKPGLFSPTPDQIDYLAGQVGGGVTREIIKVGQAAMNIGSTDKLPAHKIPVVSRFYGEVDSDLQTRSRYYNLIKEMSQHELEVKGLGKAGKSLTEYIKENPDVRFIGLANKTDNNIKKLKERRNALAARNVPEETLKQIDTLILANMKRLNEAYKSAHK